MRTLRCLFATLIVAAPTAGAQVGGVCPLIIIDDVVQQPNVGPGEAFGVTAYQCASCSFKREKDMAPEYSFGAEPMVLQTTSWSQLRSGDRGAEWAADHHARRCGSVHISATGRVADRHAARRVARGGEGDPARPMRTQRALRTR